MSATPEDNIRHLSNLVQGVLRAQSKGAYSLEESSALQKSVAFFTKKEEPEPTETAAAADVEQSLSVIRKEEGEERSAAVEKAIDMVREMEAKRAESEETNQAVTDGN